MFPLNLTFDAAGFDQWKRGYMEHFTFAPEKVEFLMQFHTSIWLPLQQYRTPVIELRNDTPKVAVCQVFEKVNTGGVTLTAFEIVTATFAADGFRLIERLGRATRATLRATRHAPRRRRHRVSPSRDPRRQLQT